MSQNGRFQILLLGVKMAEEDNVRQVKIIAEGPNFYITTDGLVARTSIDNYMDFEAGDIVMIGGSSEESFIIDKVLK